jgi:hypothetical protein
MAGGLATRRSRLRRNEQRAVRLRTDGEHLDSIADQKKEDP